VAFFTVPCNVKPAYVPLDHADIPIHYRHDSHFLKSYLLEIVFRVLLMSDTSGGRILFYRGLLVFGPSHESRSIGRQRAYRITLSNKRPIFLPHSQIPDARLEVISSM